MPRQPSLPRLTALATARPLIGTPATDGKPNQSPTAVAHRRAPPHHERTTNALDTTPLLHTCRSGRSPRRPSLGNVLLATGHTGAMGTHRRRLPRGQSWPLRVAQI